MATHSIIPFPVPKTLTEDAGETLHTAWETMRAAYDAGDSDAIEWACYKIHAVTGGFAHRWRDDRPEWAEKPVVSVQPIARKKDHRSA